jgi:hypothetical protein
VIDVGTQAVVMVGGAEVGVIDGGTEAVFKAGEVEVRG